MKIAVTSPSFSKNPELRSKLSSFFKDVRFNDSSKNLTREQLMDFLGGADAAIVGLDRVDNAALEALPQLKIISKYGVGLDNIDLDACRQRNIKIGWLPGVNRLAVAELTLGYMIALSRNVFKTSQDLKSGTWNKNGGQELSSLTVGIIGVGHIGKELIRLLKAFGTKILVNDILPQKEYYRAQGVKEVDKEMLFRDVDILTLHTPLTPETRGMINAKTLSSMKESAFVINTARGGIIDEPALKEALRSGQIAGAALDVYEIEPPQDAELLKLPNLICTPHIGGNSGTAILAMGNTAIDELVRLARELGVKC